jgi:hypothetical protein
MMRQQTLADCRLVEQVQLAAQTFMHMHTEQATLRVQWKVLIRSGSKLVDLPSKVNDDCMLRQATLDDDARGRVSQ